MKFNPNKAVSAHAYGISVLYTDSYKSHSITYEESSPLKELQVYGVENRYQTVVAEKSAAQKLLYNHAMHGLKSYSPDQVRKMSYVQKMAIMDVHEQAQHRLNMWKFQLIHEKIGSFLTTLFYKSKLAKQLATYPKSVSPWDHTTVTFKELGIKKEQIIEKLIEWKILPADYYQLSS